MSGIARDGRARIEANIAPHRLALDHLAETHQWIADTYDFDLIGDSGQAATWQMAGRCIGIARQMCDALAFGYTAEVLHLARALHEADGLVGIFPVEEGTELLRQWLADEGNEWVRPGPVRAAQERFGQRIADTAREAGGPELEVPEGLQRQIYGDQSQAAHHRRKWTQDAVSPPLRTMLRGPADVWARRAVTTAAMLPVVEEAVIAVGDARAVHAAGVVRRARRAVRPNVRGRAHRAAARVGLDGAGRAAKHVEARPTRHRSREAHAGWRCELVCPIHSLAVAHSRFDRR